MTSPGLSSKGGIGVGALLIGLFLLFLFFAERGNPAAEAPEYDIKAAYLFNFAQFVQWPPQAFSSPSAPMVIGILGSDPFGGKLDRIVRGEVLRGHRLTVRHVGGTGDLRSCQILFIPKSESGRVQEALAAVRGSAVLTVGDSDHFVAQGGMIGFVMAGKSVRFQINSGAAQREGLTISSRLLRLGE